MSEQVFIRKKIGLGDSLAILNLLYSTAHENNKKYVVFGAEVIRQLLEVFHYDGLSYGGMDESERTLYNIIRLYPTLNEGPLKNNSTTSVFLTGNFYYTEATISPPKKIRLPAHKTPCPLKEASVCFQFDIRSWKYNKKKFIKGEIENFLSKTVHGNSKLIGIGGKDTEPYLPQYEYKLGAISDIAKSLLSCEKFVGADSGVMHLAGTLGVSGEILISSTHSNHADQLEFFLKSLYPTLTFHRRYKPLRIL